MTFATNTTGQITARAITVTAATSTKVYDGTTSSTATPTITAGSLASGDTAAFTETFDTRNVGTGKTLTPAGSVNDGNGGNNYTVTFATNTTGQITARAITVTAATSTKGYDGTTSSTATPTITAGSLATRRHGGLHRDLRHPERGHGQDAHAGRLGQRRQRRQQLHGDLRHQHHGPDHGAGDHGHRGQPAPRSTTARPPRRPRRRSPPAAWPAGDTAAFTRDLTTPGTWARARRSRRPARSTTATAATTTR